MATDAPTSEAAIMEAVERKPNNFKVKLRAVIGGVPKAVIARRVGVSPQTLERYFDTSWPSAPIALDLARALNVDLAWLLDEKEEWKKDYPPFEKQQSQPDLKSVQLRTLMMEVAIRHAKLAATVAGLLTYYEDIHEDGVSDATPKELRAEAIAARTWRDLWENGPASDVPLADQAVIRDLFELSQIVRSLTNTASMEVYMPRVLAEASESSNLRNFKAEDLQFQKLWARWEALTKAHPGIESLVKYFFEQGDLRKQPDDACKRAAGESLAQLLSHPLMATDKDYDALRAALRKAGFIDGQGKVTGKGKGKA